MSTFSDQRHTRRGSFGLVVRDLISEPDDEDDRLILTAAHLIDELPDGTRMLCAPAGPEPQSTDGQYCGTVRRRVPLSNLPSIGVDAAVIKPPPNLSCGNEMACGMPNGIRDLWVVDDQSETVPVQKHGAQTHMTSGELLPIAADLFVEDVRAKYNTGWWVYGNGSEFATRGDSGAVVVDDDRRVVGMLVAVDHPDNGSGAFVHGIKQVLKALQIDLS